jgi:hypothetical protein
MAMDEIRTFHLIDIAPIELESNGINRSLKLFAFVYQIQMCHLTF